MCVFVLCTIYIDVKLIRTLPSKFTWHFWEFWTPTKSSNKLCGTWQLLCIFKKRKIQKTNEKWNDNGHTCRENKHSIQQSNPYIKINDVEIWTLRHTYSLTHIQNIYLYIAHSAPHTWKNLPVQVFVCYLCCCRKWKYILTNEKNLPVEYFVRSHGMHDEILFESTIISTLCLGWSV